MKNDWLSTLETLGRVLREKERASIPKPNFSPAERRQTVVSGQISRDPINRQAALLLAKTTDWLAFPPSTAVRVQPIKQQNNNKKRRQKKMKSVGETTFTTENAYPTGKNSAIPKNANPEDFYNIDDITVKVIAAINKQPHALTELARAAIDARDVLRENTKELGGAIEGLDAKVKVALEDVRQTRFAFIGEIAQMLQPLKELRQFFVGPDYEREITRLREFVDLCERLAQLKKDGTLDAIGDTIIKLAV